VIPNPVTKRFGGGELESPPDPYEDRDGLVFVGRLVEEKGCDLAIKALANLHEQGYSTHLTVCGDGPERRNLEDLTHRLSVEEFVHFRGWLSQDQVEKELSAAEALVIPSRWKEPFGLVALEALSCWTPVVASRRGGLPEAVEDCGALVEFDNVNSLTEGIRSVTREDRAEEIRSNILKKMGNHNLHDISAIYIKHLNI
jgi:glycosyltransferase involved in cell wall biosynthesis